MANEHTHARGVRLFVIYDHPSDYPDAFVVREWVVVGAEVYVAKEPLAVSPELDLARMELPSGLFNIGRGPEDDQAIREVWI